MIDVQAKVGRNANARVLPASMNKDPNCVASSEDGIITEGPPKFVPSIMWIVTLSNVKRWRPAVMKRLTDVPNANPSWHGELASGVSLIGVGARMAAASNEEAVDTNETRLGESSSQAEVRTPTVARLSAIAERIESLRSLERLFI
jgi:hypothetical protein